MLLLKPDMKVINVTRIGIDIKWSVQVGCSLVSQLSFLSLRQLKGECNLAPRKHVKWNCCIEIDDPNFARPLDKIVILNFHY